MSLWYRAHRKSDVGLVFSGDGGLYVNGRWNHMGKRAVYCSSSIALCTLEWLGHNGLSVSGFSYFRFSIDVPDALITSFAKANLPPNWDSTPATDVSRNFADTQLFRVGGPLAIAVPSVVVPEEFNLVLNPLHAEFRTVVASVNALGIHEAPNR